MIQVTEEKALPPRRRLSVLVTDDVGTARDAVLDGWNVVLVGGEPIQGVNWAPSPEVLSEHWGMMTWRSSAVVTASDSDALHAVAERQVHQSTANSETSRRKGQHWVRHMLTNLPLLTQHPTAFELADKLRHVPAFIVGAGPSLDKNVHLLEQAAKRGVVIGVNGGSKAGAPHCHLSFTSESNDLTHKMTHAPTRCYGMMCPPSMMGEQNLLQYTGELSGFLEPVVGHPKLACCGSGTTSVISMVERWGCSPIVLLGQDLAWSNGRLYAESTGLKTRWEMKDDGFMHYDWGQARSFPRPDNPLPDGDLPREVPAWGGEGMVFSNQAFEPIAKWLEKAASSLKGHQCINATEGGRSIPGWEERSLFGVLDSLPEVEVPDLYTLAGPSAVPAAALAEKLSREVARVERVIMKPWDPRVVDACPLIEPWAHKAFVDATDGWAYGLSRGNVAEMAAAWLMRGVAAGILAREAESLRALLLETRGKL